MPHLALLLMLSALATFTHSAAKADPVSDFLAADTNKNGVLEFEEFKHFVDLRAEDGSKPAKTVRRFRAYGIALGRVDYDGDGNVSGDELKRYDRENP